jgi:hypothetical protein
MNEYKGTDIVKEALQVYFSKYHFADGGYNDKFFRIKIGPVYIPVPNTKGRIAAVKIHDIHHMLTEYKATLKGEAEIAAWEIASGCGKYPEAWFLNFGSFSYGLIFVPRSLLRAFLRGKAMDTNLYYKVTYDDALLNKTIGELRAYVGIDKPLRNSVKDYLLFILWSLFSLAYTFLFCYCIYLVITWGIHKIR